MSKYAMKAASAAALCGVLCLLTACAFTYSYRRTGESFMVDPTTGHLLRINQYTYTDGVETQTVDDVTVSGIENRRRPDERGGFFNPFPD